MAITPVIPVAELPDVELIKLTHLAMKGKLQGLKLLDANGDTIVVNASYSRPEEWVKTRIAPALNINCVSIRLDPTRHTTNTMLAIT